MPHRTLAGTLSLALLASGVAAQPEFRFVDPLATDPGIIEADLPNAGNLPQRHVVARAHGEPRGMLLVWLAGSGAAPAQYLEFTAAAAREGFDAAGLVYLSWPPVNDITTNDPDPDLPAAIRTERIFGIESTDAVDVDRANSIEHRLVALLQQQAAAFPDERWASYLTDEGLPDWSRIAVAGHSQGAGHAAFLGKQRALAGALIFAGPGDFVQGLGTAPWVFEPGLTPVARTIAFTHVDDRTAAGFFLNQRILGLDAFGDLQDVDGLPERFIRTQMLASDAELPPGSNGHGAVVVDDRLPRTMTGAPLYLPVWNAMLATPTLCTADTNRDGALTPADFNGWVIAFTAQTAPCDQNSDGTCTAADFNAWVANFNRGC